MLNNFKIQNIYNKYFTKIPEKKEEKKYSQKRNAQKFYIKGHKYATRKKYKKNLIFLTHNS